MCSFCARLAPAQVPAAAAARARRRRTPAPGAPARCGSYRRFTGRLVRLWRVLLWSLWYALTKSEL